MTRVVRDRRRIAMIGLGEAGGLLAQGLVASGMFHVAGYDAPVSYTHLTLPTILLV